MLTVFLVEDNQDNADLVLDLLGGDYRVVPFRDAHAALDALHEDQGPTPALFLLDISLPGMDGVELLQRIRSMERYRRIPAVALTAHAMKDQKDRLLAAGFDDYISKPITDEAVLLGALERQLPK